MSDEEFARFTQRKEDFPVGMHVVCVKDFPDGNYSIRSGDTGVVVCVANTRYKPIGVQWDHYCGGHDLEGHSEDERGWWCPMDFLQPLYDENGEYPETDELPDLNDLIGG